MHRKSQKKLILTGAAKFNTKPKDGLAFLEEQGLVYADLGPDMTKERSLATFLKSSTRLDKKLLGDFISRPDQLGLLNAFLCLFDFQGVSPREDIPFQFYLMASSETHR